MKRFDTHDFFNRNESSYGVDFYGCLEMLVRDGVEQTCPSCRKARVEYTSFSTVGMKEFEYPPDVETAFLLIDFTCKNKSCKQISSVLTEIDTKEKHRVIWPVTEQKKQDYLMSLFDHNRNGDGDEWVYDLHEKLGFIDYSMRIVNTFPEDFFPEQAYLRGAKGALIELSVNTEKEIEYERLSTWVRTLATKIRAKDDTFFSSARKLLELFIPMAGNFNKDEGETLSGLMAKFRKVGPFKIEKVLVAGPDSVIKKTLSDALSGNIKNFIGSTDPKLVDSAVRRTVYSEIFEKTLSLNNDFESIEHKINIHKTHVLLEQLKDILNNHTHENGTPKDEDFIVACGLLNDFFCLTEKILAKHYNDKENNI